MIDLDALDSAIKDRLASLDGAPLVVLTRAGGGEELRAAAATVRQAVVGLAPVGRMVLVYPDGAGTEPEAAADPAGPALLPLPLPPTDHLPPFSPELAEAYRGLFRVGNRVGARGCVVLDADPAALAVSSLRRLVQPVLEQGLDLVLPCYSRRRFDGLLRSAVVAPLMRALYGRRIQFPLGADFALSARLAERVLQSTAPGGDRAPVWLASEAVCAGFQVGQAQLGVPLPARRDPPEASEAVAQVLGPLFLDLERNAAQWQKVRGSQPIPTFGTAWRIEDETGTVDVTRMVETFRLGYRNLQGVWSAVMPPATLLELKRLTALAPSDFRLPDELWARMVYDFALAHRLRSMSRDHLLRAMTPLYFAWLASYANEVGTAAPGAVEYRLDRLGAAYESQKPYLVSRWRWPDRFRP